MAWFILVFGFTYLFGVCATDGGVGEDVTCVGASAYYGGHCVDTKMLRVMCVKGEDDGACHAVDAFDDYVARVTSSAHTSATVGAQQPASQEGVDAPGVDTQATRVAQVSEAPSGASGKVDGPSFKTASDNGAHGTFEPVHPSWCGGALFVPNATVVAMRLHDVKAGACGQSIPDKMMASACAHSKVFTPEGALCSMLSFPRNRGDWEVFARTQRAACKMARNNYDMSCRYACPGYDSATCEVKAGPVVTFFYKRLRGIYYEEAPVDHDELEAGSRLLMQSIGSAIRNNIVNIAAQVFAGLVFVKPLPGSLRYTAVGLGATIYAFTGNWVQAAGSIVVALASSTGQQVNTNNIYFAYGSVFLSILVVAVDAANSIYFSFGATAFLFLIGFAVIAAIAHKRLTFDAGTLIHFIIGMLNLATNYRVIIMARRTDPAIATIVFTADGALPWGSAFVPFFQMRYEEARVLAVALISQLGIGREWLIPLWAGLFAHSYVCFMLLRAILGFQVMKRVKGLSPLETLFQGFVLVWTDVASPVEVVSHIAAGRGPKHFAFDACVAFLKLLELVYAVELCIASVVVALVMYIFDYQVTRVARTLSDGSFGGFSFDLSSFPVRGSIPHISLDTAAAIRRAVVNVTSEAGNIVRSGVGLMVMVGAELVVYTVDHVVWSAKSITLEKEVKSDLHEFNKTSLGAGPDPVAVVKMPADADALQKLATVAKEPLREMPVLSISEVSLVKGLLYVSSEGCINYLGPNLWKFKEDSFDVTLDLKHGDSGSPLFAVLGDGSVRYAGAVSRARGGGDCNIVSSAVEKPRAFSPGTGTDAPVITVPASTTDITSGNIAVCRMIEQHTNFLAANRDNRKVDSARRARERRRAKDLALVLKGNRCISDTYCEALMGVIDQDQAVRFNWERGVYRYDYGATPGGPVDDGESDAGPSTAGLGT